jgi:putative membrane protein
MRLFRKKKENVWLNTAAGAIGGLLGAWTMNQFQAGIAKLQTSGQRSGGEPATVKAAEQVSEATTGRELTPAQKKTAEPLVHYGFGTLVGAIYGAAAAKAPITKAGAGRVYGATVWLLADEIGVPAAGLSKPPQEVPLMKHVEALASHLVYGLTVEGVRWLSGKTRFA